MKNTSGSQKEYVVKLAMLMAKWSEKTSIFCIRFRKKEEDLSHVYLSMAGDGSRAV
jgi:hypothetical protein